MKGAASLSTNLRAHLGLKLGLAVALNLWALLPYFWLQRNHFFPVTTMAPSALDARLGFTPEAVWIYLSLFLLMPIAPLQMDGAGELRRYALGIIALSAVADLCFFFWPTAVLRAPDTGASALYSALLAVDTPHNAFPSLHAAAAIYSALCCEQIRRARAWRMIVWPWVAAILWAMLAVKQHVAWDAVGGAALGGAAYWCAFRASTAGRKIWGLESKIIGREERTA